VKIKIHLIIIRLIAVSTALPLKIALFPASAAANPVLSKIIPLNARNQ